MHFSCCPALLQVSWLKRFSTQQVELWMTNTSAYLQKNMGQLTEMYADVNFRERWDGYTSRHPQILKNWSQTQFCPIYLSLLTKHADCKC